MITQCLCLSDDLQTWEVMVAIQFLQASKDPGMVMMRSDCRYRGLCGSAGLFISDTEAPVERDFTVEDGAISVRGGATSAIAFMKPPVFGIPATHKGPIVLCPEACVPELALPESVWRAFTLHLRTYGPQLRVIVEQGRRMDYAAVSEHELVAEASPEEKLDLVAGASLVVGVPNAWTWAACGWYNKALVAFYPDDVPVSLWFPYSGTRQAKGLFASGRVKLPVVLAGLRQLIAKIPDLTGSG
jgi:hypothetical protein